MDAAPQFTISSVLTFSAPTREMYHVTLKAPVLTVAVDVWHMGGDFLGEFFAGLAGDWRGFEGRRDWHSLEHQLAFEATFVKTGGVGLRILLRDSSYDAWQIRYDLGVESGALDRVARDATVFAHLLGAAP
jgi:uncharacterized protein DUF6228